MKRAPIDIDKKEPCLFVLPPSGRHWCVWLVFAWLVFCVGSGAKPVWAAAPRRLALLIGHNQAGGRVASLRFAENDVRKIRDALIQVAGYKPSGIKMILGQSAGVVRQAMASIKQRITQIKRSRPGPVFLLLYYSGHAKDGRLLLGKTDLPFRELRLFLKQSGASLRLALFDACETGKLTKLKGLRRKRRKRSPVLRWTPTMSGEVVITATGARGSAHEDPGLRGGIFTHYFVSGLRGAADRDRNGRVTLGELYRYTYIRTLERTILSAYGPQRARVRKQISGEGQWVMASLRRPKSWLLLQKELTGAFYIWNTRRDTLLAEVSKHRGRAALIALAPGRYTLQWRRRGSLMTSRIRLQKGQQLKLKPIGKRVAYVFQTQRRGGPKKLASNPDSGADEKLWQVFSGQIEGNAFDLQYHIGGQGLSGAGLAHGPGLGLLFPFYGVDDGRLGLVMRLTYLWAERSPSTSIQYELHQLHFDLGLTWTLFERRALWLSLGGRLRGSSLLQVVAAREGRAGETILSGALGAGLFLTGQWLMAGDWFLQATLDGGMQLAPVADHWSFGWVVSLGVGIGRRF